MSTSEHVVVEPDGTLGRALRTYLDHLSVERGVAKNTLLSYRRDLKRYEKFLHDTGQTDLAAIGPNTVSAFVAQIRTGTGDTAGLGPASTARTLVAVRGFHKFAVVDGWCSQDPATGIKPPRPPQRLPKSLSIAELESILEAASAPGTVLARRDRALLELLYGTGARISEATGLDVDDLDLIDGVVRLRGKGNKERIVPVGSFATRALQDYLVAGRPGLISGASTPALFLNARGGRLSRQSAWNVLGKAARSAGVTAEVSPHLLRHSFATHLLEGGADVRVVQELLGHASVTTTQIYTMVTVDSLREVFATSHPRSLG